MIPGPTVSSRRRLGAAAQFALLAGSLLSMLDSSIVTVAISPIVRELHAPLTTVQWAVSGYLLALGTGLTATPYLARRFGTLPIYRLSLVAFTLASVGCALAPTTEMLVAGRVLQGLAGAPMVPLAMSMLLGRGDTTKSMSPVAGVLLFLGPALGPSLGGLLIDVGGWRTIFLINLPIGAAAALDAARIPAGLAPGRTPGARFDLTGLLLLATGLTVLLFGASLGSSGGWAATDSWIPVVAGLILLASYAWWSSRREHPALDLSMVRYRTPALALLLCAVASVVTYAAVFLLPVFVQSVQGHSALETGLAMLPQGLLTGLSMVLGQRLLTHLSIRTTVLIGFTALTIASLGLLLIETQTPLWVTAAILTARAAALGFIITPLLTAMLQPLNDGQLADANTLFNILQRIAGSFGVGLIATLFTTQSITDGPTNALHTTALVLTAVTATALLTSLLLPRTRNTPIGDHR